MNILFLKKLYSPIGGSEALTFQLATRLAAHGHRVRVLSLWPRRERYGFPPAADLALVHSTHRLYLNAGVELYQLRPRLGALGGVLDVLAPFNLLDYTVAHGLASGFDLVHVVCREYAAAGLRLARETGMAYVTTPLPHPGQAWGGAGRGDVAIYRQADAVMALTEAERGWYLRQGVDAERVMTVDLGPTFAGPGDGAGFRRRYGLDGPVVLFVGRKERYKGVQALARAASLVWRRHPGARFVFIGEDSAFEWLWGTFREPLDPRILNLPVVDDATKADAFAACDVFCLPSRHETFGLVFAEAWQCGKPVIAGDIPAGRALIADGVDGLLVRQSADDIASAITRLLDDPALARGMGEAGRRKIATRYNWTHTIAQTEQLYAAALARAGALLPAAEQAGNRGQLSAARAGARGEPAGARSYFPQLQRRD